MKFTKALFAAGALSLASVSGAALAQAAAVEVTAGATVYGSDGAVVGTVAQVDGDVVGLNVDGQTAGIPAGAFGQDAEGQLTIAVTKGQLVEMLGAAAAEAEAALDAALVAGAQVVTADAQVLGAVDAIDGSNVVIKGENDFVVTLPKEMFAVDANGALMARANHADILAALEAAGG